MKAVEFLLCAFLVGLTGCTSSGQSSDDSPKPRLQPVLDGYGGRFVTASALLESHLESSKSRKNKEFKSAHMGADLLVGGVLDYTKRLWSDSDDACSIAFKGEQGHLIFKFPGDRWPEVGGLEGREVILIGKIYKVTGSKIFFDGCEVFTR